MRRLPHAALALTAALVLGLSACGDDGDDEDTSASTTTEAGGSTTEPAEDATTTEADGSTTTEGDGSTTTTTVPVGDLPGEPIDIYPYEGAALSVVGVAADDTLNVRAGPGTDFEIVAELDPLSADAVATGQNRTLDDGSFWSELTVEATSGWVNTAFVAESGQTTDVTSQLPAGLGGETMLELGEAVAAARAGVEEGPQPTVTVVAGPTVGDLGEITVDVVGLADDAQKGERLHVFADPDPSGEGFTLRTVEATALCARGVTDDGLCV